MRKLINRILLVISILAILILGYNVYLVYQRNQNGGFTKEDIRKINEQVEQIKEQSKNLVPNIDYKDGKG